MRLISQEGRYDIPYEDFVLGVIKGRTKTHILTRYEGEDFDLTSYSSIEKAQKVMNLLHIAYELGGKIFEFPEDSDEPI